MKKFDGGEPMYPTGLTVLRDDSKRGLALLRSKPMRADSRISVGPGLNQQDDDVCTCGHWRGAHRGAMNDKACEGFRCGCYTFRQVEIPDDSTMGPKCQVCKKPVLGKRVDIVADRSGAFTVTWVHIDKECVTQGSTIVEEDAVQKEMFWPKVNESGPVYALKKVTTSDTNNVDDRPPVKIGPTKGTFGERAWNEELEKTRAERDKPTRAPFEIGGDEHV